MLDQITSRFIDSIYLSESSNLSRLLHFVLEFHMADCIGDQAIRKFVLQVTQIIIFIEVEDLPKIRRVSVSWLSTYAI